MKRKIENLKSKIENLKPNIEGNNFVLYYSVVKHPNIFFKCLFNLLP